MIHNKLKGVFLGLASPIFQSIGTEIMSLAEEVKKIGYELGKV